jgi:hypothetical protein
MICGAFQITVAPEEDTPGSEVGGKTDLRDINEGDCDRLVCDQEKGNGKDQNGTGRPS